MDKLEEQRLAEQMEEEKEVPTELMSDLANLFDLWLTPLCYCCTVLITTLARCFGACIEYLDASIEARHRDESPGCGSGKETEQQPQNHFVTLAQRALAAWPALPSYFATRGAALRGRGDLS